MINSAKNPAKRSHLFKTVQPSYKSANDLPDGLILLESIKTLETDLQKRNMLNTRLNDVMHPLWFLAETERNIFLWRTGFSLEDSEQFEFWIDINKLIEKRLKQIENLDPENPFFNSLWGLSNNNSSFLNDESEYLKSFKDVINSIISHASALSAVTSILSKEFCK